MNQALTVRLASSAAPYGECLHSLKGKAEGPDQMKSFALFASFVVEPRDPG